MRTFSGSAHALILISAFSAVLAHAPAARAQTIGNLNNNPYYFNNQNYSYGLYLPQVPQPNGQDEIRAADGTTCRSSMASNNAYLDVGGIGGADQDGSFNSGTVYGRIIVPLGGIPERLDCSSLYNLEIERLKHELALVRAGAAGGSSGGFVPSSSGPAGKDKVWAETGWSNKGFKPGDKSSAANASPADKLPAKTVVPMRLQPKGAVNGATQAAAAITKEATVEILPWSGEPAQAARVLMGVPSKRVVVEAHDEPMPQSLLR